MSPDPSLKDRLSESIKEDEEDADEYDIFTTPSGTRNQQSSLQQSWNQQLTFQQQQQQQQYEYYRQLREYQQQQPREYQQPPPSEKPMTPLRILRPHHPMVLQRTVSMPHYPTLHTFYQQSKQTHSHIPPQTQRQCAANSSQTPFPASSEYGQHSMTSIPQYTPNSPPYHVPGAERFVPLPEQFSDLATLDHYLSTLQTQRPILQNTIPVLDQDMDLMMLSSLTLAIQDDSNHMNQLNTTLSFAVMGLGFALSRYVA
ncbi:hypothetical protein EDD11_005085 [Mortierella claussenii]|nr:hypothetical protein EDD11_005085 [Mortierella claussenii]